MADLSPVRLAIDLDGCLADWHPAFVRILQGVNPEKASALVGQGLRTYDFWDQVGFTRAEMARAWKVATEEQGWWYNLAPSSPTVKQAFDKMEKAAQRGAQIYLISERPRSAWMETLCWVAKRGLTYPQLILVKPKLPLLVSLGVQACIEDRPDLVLDLYHTRPEIRTYLMRQPWNKDLQRGYPADLQVSDVEEMLGREGL